MLPRVPKISRTRPARLGSGIIEVLVAVSLMSVVLGVAAHMSMTMIRYRTNVDRQRVSSEAANNLMEVVMSMSFERIDQRNLEKIADEVAEGTWKIEVEELQDSDMPAKRVSVQVSIGPESKFDNLRKPLVAWRYLNETTSEDNQP